MPDEYINKSISEFQIWKRTGANIVGYKNPQGEYIINPDPDTKIIPGAKLFVLGTPQQVESMKSVLKDKQKG